MRGGALLDPLNPSGSTTGNTVSLVKVDRVFISSEFKILMLFRPIHSGNR